MDVIILAVSVMLYAILSGIYWNTFGKRLFSNLCNIDLDSLRNLASINRIKLIISISLIFVWITSIVFLREYLPLNKQLFIIVLVVGMFIFDEIKSYYWYKRKAINKAIKEKN